MNSRSVRFCAALIIAITPWLVTAQTASTAVAVPYQPSLSDLMNIGVQPRHIKLWLAGKEQNWTYAAYELDELRNAFARVGRTVPVYRTLDMPLVLNAFMQKPLDDMSAAIKSQDAKAYTAAYRLLTNQCNACHQGSEHSMVVVKVPDAGAYVDQDFTGKAK
ncbi:MAG: hypothetical protein QM808_17985 [Steroidobacteraceae bacterium]